MLKHTVRRAGLIGVLALALVATSGASIAPTSQSISAQIAKAAPTGAEVDVFVFCKPDGSYSYNAIGSGFGRVVQYNIHAVRRSYWVGGGSTSSTEGHGRLYSSRSGYITTPSYYSGKDSKRESVSVRVVIGGVGGTGSANCD